MNEYAIISFWVSICLLNVYASNCSINKEGILHNNLLDFTDKVYNCSSKNITGLSFLSIQNADNSTNTALLVMDLSHNSISGSIANLYVSKLRNLSILNLSYNTITYVRHMFLCFRALKTLYLNNNHINICQVMSFKYLRKLIELHLGNNRIVSVTEMMMHGLNNLKFLDLSNNYIDVLHLGSLDDLTSIDTLNLRHNRLSLKNSPFANLSTLRQLYISNNHIVTINRNNFKGLEKFINEIDLAHNNIRKVSCYYFSRIKSLYKLKLDHNSIEQFEKSNSTCNYLQNLDINNNRLRSMDFISNFPGLKYINISHNEIPSLRKYTILMLHKAKELDLFNNSLNCECEFKMKSEENILKHMDFSEGKCYFNRDNVHPLPICPISTCEKYEMKSIICYSKIKQIKGISINNISIIFVCGIISGCFMVILVVFVRLSLFRDNYTKPKCDEALKDESDFLKKDGSMN